MATIGPYATWSSTTFTTSGTWTLPANVTAVDILLVGGGGGGGCYQGLGGGGGGQQSKDHKEFAHGGGSLAFC